jgi:hypothetical protein
VDFSKFCAQLDITADSELSVVGCISIIKARTLRWSIYRLAQANIASPRRC